MKSLLCLTILCLLGPCSDEVPVQSETATVAIAEAPQETTLPLDLQGAWIQENGSRVIHFEPARVVESDGGNLVVRGVIRRDGNHLVLRNKGLKEEWTAFREGPTLRIAGENGATRYRRLDYVPPQVDLKPLVLAAPVPLPPEQVQAIQAEIARRFEEEQAILSDPARQGEYEAVRVANLAYLRELLGAVGWIGEDRFGSKTSMQVVFMAKHTGDLQLLMTLLPYVEKEFKKPKRAQTFAILYDAVQLELGERQRYGTQVYADERGPFVLPLEDPQKVNLYLEEMGLPPLQEYLDQVSEVLYAGKTVEIRPDEGG